MNIDSILSAMDKLDADRDKIAQRRADRLRRKVIGGKRHPHPTGLSYSYNDIGTQTPNALLKSL